MTVGHVEDGLRHCHDASTKRERVNGPRTASNASVSKRVTAEAWGVRSPPDGGAPGSEQARLLGQRDHALERGLLAARRALQGLA